MKPNDPLACGHPEIAHETINALLAHIKAVDPVFANNGPECTCERAGEECGPFVQAWHSDTGRT